jgi:RHS repeat-associated protein
MSTHNANERVNPNEGSLPLETASGSGLAARYDYDPWGRRTKTDGSGPEGDFGFTGHYYHAPSGLHLTLYRAYSAELGRWLSRDPIDERDGFNLFEYADNGPTLNVDALGLTVVISPSCTAQQAKKIKKALEGCDKAKKCAEKCEQSTPYATDGITKLCDSSGTYTIHCEHNDFPTCATGNCGAAPVCGDEMHICPSSFDPKSGCGKGGVGCTMFHEALHSGGLPGGSTWASHPPDFIKFEKCMGCQ